MPGVKGVRINGRKMRNWRLEENLSRLDLARILDAGTSSVDGWEQGARGLSDMSRTKFKHAFGFDPVDKFGRNSREYLVSDDFIRPVKFNHKQLTVWRNELELTQKQLAEEINVGIGTIHDWERNGKKISFESRKKFKKVYKFDPAVVFRHPDTTDEELYLGQVSQTDQEPVQLDLRDL